MHKGRFRIGLLGGMFDPVHHGHLSSALAVQQELGLDEVRLIPCGTPAHRRTAIAPAEDRLAMLRLAIEGEQALRVDEREIRRAGPSYTVDTLESLRAERPDAVFYLVLGADAFNSLPGWHRWRDLFELAHLIVLDRPGWILAPEESLRSLYRERKVASIDEMNETAEGRILHCGFSLMMIASSRIREMIGAGKSVRYLLPETVRDHLELQNLYTH